MGVLICSCIEGLFPEVLKSGGREEMFRDVINACEIRGGVFDFELNGVGETNVEVVEGEDGESTVTVVN